MDRTILLVDDERNILKALKRILRSEGYKIFLANNGQEALDIIQSENIQVVLSDQRMPNMTGSELLAKVNSSHPETVRMILSGYSDFEGVVEAINDGSVYRFMSKPWNDGTIKSEVRNAFEVYEERRDAQLFDDLTGLHNRYYLIQELPTFINDAISREKIVSIAVVSLDRFQTINNAFGYETGDSVLKAVGDRMKNWNMGEVVRLGEDEFAIMISDVSYIEKAEELADTIVKNFEKPFIVDNCEYNLSASVGISWCANDNCEESLMNNAINAMKCIKQLGGNGYRCL